MLTDNEIRIVCKQVKVNLEIDCHLVGEIVDFLNLKREENNVWEFRFTEEKDFYWVNSESGELTGIFPHLSKLKD